MPVQAFISQPANEANHSLTSSRASVNHSTIEKSPNILAKLSKPIRPAIQPIKLMTMSIKPPIRPLKRPTTKPLRPPISLSAKEPSVFAKPSKAPIIPVTSAMIIVIGNANFPKIFINGLRALPTKFNSGLIKLNTTEITLIMPFPTAVPSAKPDFSPRTNVPNKDNNLLIIGMALKAFLSFKTIFPTPSDRNFITELSALPIPFIIAPVFLNLETKVVHLPKTPLKNVDKFQIKRSKRIRRTRIDVCIFFTHFSFFTNSLKNVDIRQIKRSKRIRRTRIDVFSFFTHFSFFTQAISFCPNILKIDVNNPEINPIITPAPPTKYPSHPSDLLTTSFRPLNSLTMPLLASFPASASASLSSKLLSAAAAAAISICFCWRSFACFDAVRVSMIPDLIAARKDTDCRLMFKIALDVDCRLSTAMITPPVLRVLSLVAVVISAAALSCDCLKSWTLPMIPFKSVPLFSVVAMVVG